MYPHKQSRNTRVFWSSPKYRLNYSLQLAKGTAPILHNGATDLWQRSACNTWSPRWAMNSPCDKSKDRNCPKLYAPRIQKNKIAQEETTMEDYNILETSSCNISPCPTLRSRWGLRSSLKLFCLLFNCSSRKTQLWRTDLSLSTSDLKYCPLYLCMLAVQWCSRWRSNFWMAQLVLVDGPRRSVSAGVYCNAFLFPQRNS